MRDFSTPTEITRPLVNVFIERDPYVIGDGRIIYWTSERDLQPPRVFRAEGTVPFDWGTPAPVANVNRNDGDGPGNRAPVVTPSELVIYWAHGPLAYPSDWEIWRASGTSAGRTPFGNAQKVMELSHPALDAPTWVSADDCVLYFQSTRGADGTGDPTTASAISSARRPL